jgi:hypothetical protein
VVTIGDQRRTLQAATAAELTRAAIALPITPSAPASASAKRCLGPESGFDVLRAPLVKSRTVAVPGGQLAVGDAVVSEDRSTTFMLVRGRVAVAPDGTIELDAGTRLELSFASPVAVLDVDVVARHGPTVSALAGGAIVGATRAWADMPPWQWVARAIDEVVIEGPGSVESLRIRRVEDAAPWTTLAHLCLPLDDPRYRCSPRDGSAADVARSRLPDGDAWARYEPGFADLERELQIVVLGDPPPAAPAPAAGVATNSIALLADLIHNAGDALTAVPLASAFLLRSERAEHGAGLAVVLHNPRQRDHRRGVRGPADHSSARPQTPFRACARRRARRDR